MRILLVEDNHKLAKGLCAVLRSNEYAVDVAFNGLDADAALASQQFDAVVLDLNLPEKDGLDILRTMRARGLDTPVLILTARDDLADRVKGLDLGADDYLTKPFEVTELEARIRVLLRRAAGISKSIFEFGPLVLDTVGNSLECDGKPIELSSREFSVLRVIINSRGRLIPKSKILDSISTFDTDISENAIEQAISRLRRRLSEYGVGIKSSRGLGYFLFHQGSEP